MRHRPLRFALFIIPVLFLTIRTPVRDALEVAVQAAAAKLRNPFADARLDGSRPRPPSPVEAFLDAERARPGRSSSARIVKIIAAGGRFHVVVDRGREDGVRVGDLALFRPEAGRLPKR